MSNPYANYPIQDDLLWITGDVTIISGDRHRFKTTSEALMRGSVYFRDMFTDLPNGPAEPIEFEEEYHTVNAFLHLCHGEQPSSFWLSHCATFLSRTSLSIGTQYELDGDLHRITATGDCKKFAAFFTKYKCDFATRQLILLAHEALKTYRDNTSCTNTALVIGACFNDWQLCVAALQYKRSAVGVLGYLAREHPIMRRDYYVAIGGTLLDMVAAEQTGSRLDGGAVAEKLLMYSNKPDSFQKEFLKRYPQKNNSLTSVY